MPDAKCVEGQLKYGYESDWIEKVIELHNKTPMGRSDSNMVDRAFSKSQVVASIWREDQLLAIGRMLTDFEMYASIFDVVVDPEVQKSGYGKRIMDALIEKAPGTCIFLTSTFGNEAFYIKQGFRYHKSALAKYPEFFGESPYLDWERGVE